MNNTNTQGSGANAVTGEPRVSDSVPEEDFYYITRKMTCDLADTAVLIRNIWMYIFRFTSREDDRLRYDEQPMLTYLKEATRILHSEPTVLDLKEKVCIVGDIHGQGDSLVTFFSINGMPPTETYVFLGNYAGEGFAPHETLFLVIALKIRYPKQIYLLKGNLEDSEVMAAQEFVAGLFKRGLSLKVWEELVACLNALPLCAVLNKRHLCVHGGIGPVLAKKGLRRLRKVRRPPRNNMDIVLTMECQWACYRASTMLGDGSPLFGEEEINEFCTKSKILTIIRSRQIVGEGVLNLPARMLTVWSATSFLDIFRNTGAVLKIDPIMNTAVVVRYKMMEDEPKSLDDKRPMGGRNARILS